MSRYPVPVPIFGGLKDIENNMFSSTFVPETDVSAASDFLKQYDGNAATFNAYRREVERLLQWAGLIKQASILSLKRQDIEEYIAFCLSPPKSWISLQKVSRFIVKNGESKPNPVWRPFVATVSKAEHKKGAMPAKDHYRLSAKAVQEIFTVLSSFYNFLLLEEKVSANPVALIRQKSKYIQKRQTQAPIRRLTDQQWEVCLKTILEMIADAEDKIHVRRHERTLFILSALYLMYLRVSELAASTRWTPQMNHFYQDSYGRWWFKTVGKGNKMREIAVTDSMLKALKRYRSSRNLPPLPSPHENEPLIPKEIGKGAVTSTKLLYDLVQDCFDKATEKLRQIDSESADALQAATVHWLRHTGISDDINKHGRPTAHVRDDAGHSSSATTDKYNDITLAERYRSAKKKRLPI